MLRSVWGFSLAVGLALGCGADDGGSGGNNDGQADGADDGSGGTGEGGGDSGSAGDGGGTGSGDGTTGDEPCEVPGGEPACDIEEVACAQALTGEDYVDCGILTVSNSTAEWQAAHDCALDAYNNGPRGFKLVVYLQEEGYAYALVGVENNGYRVTQFDQDPGPEIIYLLCNTMRVAEDCTVAPPAMCLECPITDSYDIGDVCP